MNTPDLHIAINRSVINKVERSSSAWKSLTAENENVTLTLADFVKHIRNGHPFMAQHRGRRSTQNFVRSNVLAVDIDEGMTFDELLQSQFVQDFSAVIYTTPSHTTEKPRLRGVFVLERDICNEAEMRAAYQGLIKKFGGDQACIDACRLFFGSSECQHIVIGKTLRNDQLDSLIARGREDKVSEHASDKSASKTTTRSSVTLKPDQEVRCSNGGIARLNDLNRMTAILCPIHEDRRPSALVVTNSRGINGVYCKTCCATFWPPNRKPHFRKSNENEYDFNALEDSVLREQYEANPYNLYDPDEADTPLGLMVPTSVASNVFTSKYLPDLTVCDGVNFIRSPKGSGKTKFLKRLIDKWKREGRSVLLIGHRQTLIHASSASFDLVCYLVMKKRNGNQPFPSHYAISVDSISSILNPEIDKYDVVVIDESEQVFSHLLSSTLSRKRRQCYLTLFHYLEAAKSVVVADADMGAVTVEALSLAVGDDSPYLLHLNQYKESRCPVYCYENDEHLMTDLMRSIEKGGRYYIATNSKRKAETINEAIRTKFGDVKKVMLVTSDTAEDSNVSDFIGSICTEILKVDVTIATPTLGTGIDITFDDAASLIDGVYGFFVSRVNTHFDIDQQLSRVRHPGEIRVWVDPQRYHFETEFDVIRSEIIENSDLEDFLIGYKNNGRRIFDEKYITLYAHITAMTRASKNDLRGNFQALRKRNGWQLIDVSYHADDAKEGKTTIDSAKQSLEQQRADAICNAISIDSFEYDNLRTRHKSGKRLSTSQKSSMRRFEIESFYRENISPELLEHDDHGRYREKIRTLQLYLTPTKRLVLEATSERLADILAPDRSYKIGKQLLLHTLLEAAGVADVDQPVKTHVRISRESLARFSKVAKREAAKIQEFFDVSIRKDIHRNAVQQLGVILSLMGLTYKEVERKKVKGVSERYYQIDEENWRKVLGIVERRLEAPISKQWELQAKY